MKQINTEMINELDNTNGNIRTIVLVFQSHVEFYIYATISMLFETRQLRNKLAFDKYVQS